MVPDSTGRKAQVRSPSFADHYSRAGQFYISQTETEQKLIGDAWVFELSKCQRPDMRSKTVAHLRNIDEKLALTVATVSGWKACPNRRAPRWRRTCRLGLREKHTKTDIYGIAAGT